MTIPASVAAPAFVNWRTTTVALACATLIGGIGGLFGHGGGEFRSALCASDRRPATQQRGAADRRKAPGA